MREHKRSKIIGLILGVLLMVAGIGYGLLYLVSVALRANEASISSDFFALAILAGIGLLGFITIAGPFKIKLNPWKTVFFWFCMIAGTIALIFLFITMGALGTIFEILILSIGLLYFILGYLIKTEQ